MIRDSQRQPWLTAAFVATLADFSKDLAQMVVPATWRAGDMGMEKLIFDLAHRVELSGNDSTMRSIVSRHPRRPIVTRGSRVSVGVVPRESDTDQWQEGFAADIVIFDPEKVNDPATYNDPHHYAVGFTDVLVNGVPVIRQAQLTTARPGKPVRLNQ